MHGLGSDRRQPLGLFGHVVRATRGDDELVLAPEARAHGSSTLVGGPDDFELDRLADEIADDVRRVVAVGGGDPAPVTIMGISMGAAIALRICLRGLLPVERAVFVRPSFDDRSLPRNLRAFPVIGELLAEHGPGGVEAFRRTSVYRRIEAKSPAGARGLLAQFTAPQAVERAVRLIEIPRNRAYDHPAELGAVADRGIRSLVIGAPRDPVHPVKLADVWARSLGADSIVVPARDDGLPAQTAQIREALADWLERS
nr:alpha/beta hydrolase [Agromyces seonyuensis]